METDCLIIGGGPAGMTAALYMLRAGRKVLVLEKENFGGQIAESPRLENFPSVKSISGLDFSNNLFEQILDLGADYDLEEVESVTKMEDGRFEVKTNYETHHAKVVIIATGVKHKHLGNPREKELTGHGISYCAVCDGDFFIDKDVVLIGDANTALQYALMLSAKCHTVSICTLFDRFFADQILVDAIEKVANIHTYHNLNTKDFLGDEELTGVVFENTQTHEEKTFSCEGVFIAIGQVPDNGKFANLVEITKQGFIKTDNAMRTKTEGLYAVGDCREKEMRQVITATSDGAIAAIEAANYLNLH